MTCSAMVLDEWQKRGQGVFRLALKSCNYILVVDANHDRGCLDHGIRSLADFQLQFADCVHGDGGGNHISTADVDLDNAVDSTFLNVNNGTLELISRA